MPSPKSDPPPMPVAEAPVPEPARERRLRIGIDIRGEPVVAWRTSDGRFLCAWIDEAGDRPRSRAAFIAETDTLGGRIKGVESVEPVPQAGDDLRALIACAKERGAFRE